MLLQSRQLRSLPVVSMRTGGTLAYTRDPIINPFQLEISGIYTTHDDGSILLLHTIREIAPKQVTVDDSDAFSHQEDLPRLEEILRLNYELIGKHVTTQSKQRLGKVEDYVVDTLSHKIQKIHVHQPLWRNFHGSTLIIDRQQIISVNDRSVTVSDGITNSTALATQHSLP